MMQRLKKAVVPIGVALVIILVAIAVYGTFWNARQETAESTLPPLATTQSATSNPPAQPSTSSSPTAKPTVATTPTSSSPPPPPLAPPAIQPVAASAPTHMTITTTFGLVVDARVGEMDYREDLAAPSCSENPDDLNCPNTAYWIHDQMGVAPASSTTNSTYIMGHSWTQGHRVFDDLSNYAMKHYDPAITAMKSTDSNGNPMPAVDVQTVPSLEGSVIVLTTGTGTLTYSVQKVYIVRKEDVGWLDDFRNGTPNQLKIDTCGIDLQAGVDTEFAVLIIADLTAAVPN